MMAPLPYRVERKSNQLFELVAAFKCAAAARLYAADCEADNPGFTYRVVTTVCKKPWNRWDASRPWLTSEEE